MQQTNNSFFCFGLLMIAVSFSLCNSQAKKPTEHQTLELTASLGGVGFFYDTVGVIYVATTIYNPTTDTVKFVSMSCSYEDLFTIDKKNLKVQSRYDCYSNVPIVISLPPKAKTDRYIMVTRTNKNDTVEISKIKIGMYYQTPKNGASFNDIINLHDHRHDAEVLWSNELDMRRFNNIIY